MTDHLDPREHPIRERVHFPGQPGHVTAADHAQPAAPATMAESTTPETVTQPADQAASLGVALPTTFGTPTITQDPPPDAAGEDAPKPRSRRARAEAKEGQS